VIWECQLCNNASLDRLALQIRSAQRLKNGKKSSDIGEQP
jgi:hypothetical protein